jgi:murein L,D-transpeptidase YcbB/YkuD
VLPGLGSTFVAVNIPAFRAYFVRDDSLVWSGRAVVGEPYLQTPEFQSRITSLVLNPTWTVPPQILTDEVLPDIGRDSTYLARNGMQVIDGTGAAVNPADVDWSRYDGRTLPYRIVQAPGSENPLGRIKFVFPNAYAVYLHDTPARTLFQRSQRTFSHGCIRVQHPMTLATALLNDSTWAPAALDSVAALEVETSVALAHPVPILILYWTAWPAEDGALNFRPDVYGRDSAVLAALDAPFSFTAAAH